MASEPRFTQIKNPLTGKIEWKAIENDEDFSTELSISHYCDMLHDIERNEKYRLAIEKTVRYMLEARRDDGGDDDDDDDDVNNVLKYKKIKALDLGTGTGLLSMFACNVNKSRVTSRGIEVFKPIAEIAKKCIKLNNLEENIKIINCRSDDLPVDVDESEKSNLLITELFDTELIGEGCLESYACALKQNCSKNCLAVPFKAKVFAQIVNSEFISNFQRLRPDLFTTNSSGSKKASFTGFTPSQKLYNAGPFYDFQMNELKIDQDFKILSDPLEIYSLNFTDYESVSKFNERIEIDFSEKLLVNLNDEIHQSSISKNNIVLFTWWDLVMDYEEEIVLSLAPYWARTKDGRTKTGSLQNNCAVNKTVASPTNSDSGGEFTINSIGSQSVDSDVDAFTKVQKSCVSVGNNFELPWRDHWLQAAYFINGLDDLKFFNHDNYSCWFGRRENDQISALWCRDRFYSNNTLVSGQLVDEFSRQIETALAEFKASKNEQDDTRNTVIFFGDSTVAALLLADRFRELEFVHIYTNTTLLEKDFYKTCSLSLNLKNLKILPLSNFDEKSKEDSLSSSSFLILGEPYFSSSSSCWHDLLFLNKFKNLSHFPQKFSIKVALIEFKDLYKIRYPVGVKSNLDLKPIDDIVQKALDDSHQNSKFECFNLWEYPCEFRSEILQVFNDTAWSSFDGQKVTKKFKLLPSNKPTNKIHAIVTWMEWTHTTKPTTTNNDHFLVNYGYNAKKKAWYPGRKQTLKFLAKEINLGNPEKFLDKHGRQIFKKEGAIEIEFDFSRLSSEGEVAVNV